MQKFAQKKHFTIPLTITVLTKDKMHKREYILKNETHKILWDIEIKNVSTNPS